MLLRIIQLMIDTHVEHNVFTLAGGADDHLLRSAGQVPARLVRRGKPARGFQSERSGAASLYDGERRGQSAQRRTTSGSPHAENPLGKAIILPSILPPSSPRLSNLP